jgi:hypothetical protein
MEMKKWSQWGGQRRGREEEGEEDCRGWQMAILSADEYRRNEFYNSKTGRALFGDEE